MYLFLLAAQSCHSYWRAVKTVGEAHALDQKVSRVRRLADLKGHVTHIPVPVVTPDEVIGC